MYKCLHGSAPAYLDELCQVADVEARRRLRSSSSSSLIVSRTRLSTIGDRAFPVAAASVWNSLPDHVTSAPSVAVFRSRLKTHLFNISYPSPLWLYSACAVTLSYFGHFNRSCLLACLLTLPFLLLQCAAVLLIPEDCRQNVFKFWEIYFSVNLKLWLWVHCVPCYLLPHKLILIVINWEATNANSN